MDMPSLICLFHNIKGEIMIKKRSPFETVSVLSKGLMKYFYTQPKALLAAIFVLALGFQLFCFAFISNEIPSTPAKSHLSTDKSYNSTDESLLKYLRDRPFLSEFPVDPRKTYKIYVFGKDDMGVFITAKNFRQVIEVFFYKVKSNVITINFLNAKIKGDTPFRIKECSGPGSFDLTLELDKDLKNDKRQSKYYSWKKLKKPPANTLNYVSYLNYITD